MHPRPCLPHPTSVTSGARLRQAAQTAAASTRALATPPLPDAQDAAGCARCWVQGGAAAVRVLRLPAHCAMATTSRLALWYARGLKSLPSSMSTLLLRLRCTTASCCISCCCCCC